MCTNLIDVVVPESSGTNYVQLGFIILQRKFVNFLIFAPVKVFCGA